jgi:two-component system chemotaxis response regulator CheB
LELIPKIRQFFAAPAPSTHVRTPGPVLLRTKRPRVLAIGVSTGGPQALGKVIPRLPKNFPLPIVVVQHMPAMFTRMLAESLQSASSLQVREAAEGMDVQPGYVLIAPGDFHLRVRREGQRVLAALNQEARENSCRPAVDVLFRSLAEVYGGDVLSLVLTGMGQDGLRGIQVLKAAGASTIVQDEATSVVWGMPGAVARAGLADRILPIEQISSELVRLVQS